MLRFYFNRKRRALLLGLLLTASILLLYLLSYHHIKNTSYNLDNSTVYDIVLDAGSTGSRIHVFVFKKSGNDLELRSEHFKRVEPGLSSFASDASAAVDSLKPLLEVAISSVPPSHYRSTAVTLKATAGLRLLPKDQQIGILNAVDAYLNSTPFSNRGVSVITGDEEAVYGWMTLNYLLGRFDSNDKPPVVAIDMGGASTQIIFKTPTESAEWLPFRYALHLKIKESGFTLYHHSYLGFGLNEARKRIMSHYNDEQMLVCLSDGASKASGTKNETKGFLTTLNFDSCTELVRKAVFSDDICKHASCGIKGVPQPPIRGGEHEIHAFSYFYDLLRRIMPVNAPLSVASIREASQKVCNNPNHPASKGSMCLDLAYLYSYLSYGLKLSDTTLVHVADEIKGQSLSWSLGDSLAYLWKTEMTQY
ncbi:unnamed protein product [Phytomonas sp. EM1]|nr:unnamed protein product [Phytomonas sp. EM1]|eukprot:CCW65458.1 unnamed protein product [Phytomonas sp. isolate EM1]